MNHPELVARIEELARRYFDQVPDAVELWVHTQLVRRFAVQLARIEGADAEALEIAALLHDIGKCKGLENHSMASRELSEALLRSFNLPEGTKQLILECVLEHSSRFASEDSKVEVKVIQSADALALFFDDAWQEYSKKNLTKEAISELIDISMTKVRLESARKIAEPQVAKLRASLL